MPILNSTQARANFYGLLTQVNESHEPVTITGKKGNAVLIAEEDWQAINETLHLLSIPGLRESVIEGLHTPLDECSTELNW
ncbi:type II toxin-antitoxin system Phd/YefM family antitoxin [Thiomicrorhabdus aquaedulcis]|uniref:type II toxin-antitoxin system Phd/YefM family antitoxin n=1 Tax=Thiomicrorhabdus aquaedulcis TaxID=2211106 RepID=UPI000FD7CEB0|nr:type II toxin-antitoxin system Phd/YefM family antitoxin [Thiomicrorhabdus aquaedulcis]